MPTRRRRIVMITALAAATAVAGSASAAVTTCTPARGATCSGANLRGAHLRGADLRRADLRDAHLEGADLRGARLAGARLHRAHLRGARLERADLSGAVLDGADFTGARLRHARLTRAHIGRAIRPVSGGHHEAQASTVCTPQPGGWCASPQFANADLTGASLAGVRVLFGNFSGANLTGANIAGALFQRSDLSQAVFATSTATGPVPTARGDAMRVGASFNQSNVTGTSFAGANLSGVGFPFTDATVATFTGAYVAVTWWLNGVNDMNGVSWPAASCAYAPIAYDAQQGSGMAFTPCTATLPGGGSVTFGNEGLTAQLQLPTPTPSWWPRFDASPTTNILLNPGSALYAIGVWQPPGFAWTS